MKKNVIFVGLFALMTVVLASCSDDSGITPENQKPEITTPDHVKLITDKAQLAVLELSKMLRHMLYDNHQKFVPLQSEADFIRTDVELMRLRLARDVEVNVDVRVHPERGIQIAPLLFISLVENAFKHGISPTEPSFVSISLLEEDDCVCCIIRNSNFPKYGTDKSGSGIGL